MEALGARDAGDLDVRIVGTERDPESGIVGYPTVVATCEGVRDGIAPLLRDGAFPVVLGGCCTLVPGVAAALRTVDPRPAGMAYVDGHLDLYDGRTSPTGEAADLPLAIVAGHGDPALVALGPDVPMIEPRHIALLAHRDSDEARSVRERDARRSRDRGVARLRRRAGGRTGRGRGAGGCGAGRLRGQVLALDRRRRDVGRSVPLDARQAARRPRARRAGGARASAGAGSGLCRPEPDVLRRRHGRRRAILGPGARRAGPALVATSV